MSRNELSEKTRINVGVGVLWTAVVVCVLGTATAATSYVNILNRLDRMDYRYVHLGDFEEWRNNLAAQNPAQKVPPFPHQHESARVGVAAIVSRTDVKEEN